MDEIVLSAGQAIGIDVVHADDRTHMKLYASDDGRPIVQVMLTDEERDQLVSALTSEV